MSCAFKIVAEKVAVLFRLGLSDVDKALWRNQVCVTLVAPAAVEHEDARAAFDQRLCRHRPGRARPGDDKIEIRHRTKRKRQRPARARLHPRTTRQATAKNSNGARSCVKK